MVAASFQIRTFLLLKPLLGVIAVWANIYSYR
jgi:hypothetical protein